MKGFTLIELLVVVLIIGILSAVALPQYQKAVEKSRAAQALAVLKSLAAAEQSYYMANGQYANYFDELDVELPWSGAEKWYSMATDTRSNGEWSLQKVNSSQHKIIYIGRLTGKYKGGGFGYFLYDNSALYETDVITCLERTGAGTVFNEADGAYCRQVMGGTFKAMQGSTRQYTLP
ncbi:MAG: type IV pilin protein [Candidatus Avelusimicrobium sp.]|uniref:type IV pilin protein n=1 Tax=Candidatus Avelusimicrobium sp. TaxID=3048833 RepID=UPI003EFC0038